MNKMVQWCSLQCELQNRFRYFLVRSCQKPFLIYKVRSKFFEYGIKRLRKLQGCEQMYAIRHVSKYCILKTVYFYTPNIALQKSSQTFIFIFLNTNSCLLSDMPSFSVVFLLCSVFLFYSILIPVHQDNIILVLLYVFIL